MILRILKAMKNRNAPGFFDYQDRMTKLVFLKDPLVSIGAAIDFEQFRTILEKATLQDSYSKGGRPPFDRVMLFKALVLQKIYDLSDDQLEYQINDRMSFMRFMGLQLSDKVPDAKTYWYFREALSNSGVIDNAFIMFRDKLREHGYMLQEGKIVDASLIKAPIQRNSRRENEQLKQGQTPEEWSDHKLSQKDLDASWTRKHGKNYYGYKNHIKIDSGSKLIDEFEVTTASVHDSQVIIELLDDTDKGNPIWADSAYESAEIRKELKRQNVGCRIQKKGSKNKSLSIHQKMANRIKSKTRSRVEHVFASIKNRMKKEGVRCIGLVRATAEITLQNLVYNMTRMIYLSTTKG